MTTTPEPVTAAMVRKLDVPAPRYTSYPTVPVWSDSYSGADHAAAIERSARTPTESLSAYVHVPFCRELCLYCGCNVVVAQDDKVADRYLDAVERELDLVAARIGPHRRLARLHWGGGTPTSLTQSQMVRLAGILQERFRIEPGAECAVEIDPTVTSPEKVDLLAELGFNRLSMGVQDFDPDVQDAIGRHQTIEETRERMVQARRLAFRSINFDLIYGLPRQTEKSWAHTLDRIIELHPDRLAVFSFAYLPQLRPHQRKLPVAGMPTPDLKHALHSLTRERLSAAGYQSIGMDHFALPDDELAVARRAQRLWRDFQGYTVLRSREAIAFGVTGISDIGGAYAQNVRGLTAYADALKAGDLPIHRGLRLTDDDRERREIIVDLMCNLKAELGPDGDQRFASELQQLAELEADGLVERSDDRLEITERGRPFVRNVAKAFDAHLEESAAKATFSRTV